MLLQKQEGLRGWKASSWNLKRNLKLMLINALKITRFAFTFPLALQYVVLRLRCAAFLLEVGSADLAERGASN